MKVADRLFRYWSYFRQGYSLYLAFPLGVFSNATVVYYLLVDHDRFLFAIFPSFAYFGIISTIAIGAVGTLFGRIHFKSPIFRKDSQVIVEENPYTFVTPPGISQDLALPSTIIILQILERLGEARLNPIELSELRRLIRLNKEVQKGADIRKIH